MGKSEAATDIKVGGKTPEEIKEDAEICLNHPLHETCNHCRLYNECDGMAEHIIKELYDLVLQVERERDAAVEDFTQFVNYGEHECKLCRHYEEVCLDCTWEWRGVKINDEWVVGDWSEDNPNADD